MTILQSTKNTTADVENTTEKPRAVSFLIFTTRRSTACTVLGTKMTLQHSTNAYLHTRRKIHRRKPAQLPDVTEDDVYALTVQSDTPATLRRTQTDTTALRTASSYMKDHTQDGRNQTKPRPPPTGEVQATVPSTRRNLTADTRLLNAASSTWGCTTPVRRTTGVQLQTRRKIHKRKPIVVIETAEDTDTVTTESSNFQQRRTETAERTTGDPKMRMFNHSTTLSKPMEGIIRSVGALSTKPLVRKITSRNSVDVQSALTPFNKDVSLTRGLRSRYITRSSTARRKVTKRNQKDKISASTVARRVRRAGSTAWRSLEDWAATSGRKQSSIHGI